MYIFCLSYNLYQSEMRCVIVEVEREQGLCLHYPNYQNNVKCKGDTCLRDLKLDALFFPLIPTASIGHVICSENFMAIEVNKTQSEKIRIHEDHLRLNDPSCTLYSNGTHVFANMSLNTCGTVMEVNKPYKFFGK